MHTEADSLCCRCKWTWTATCTPPSGSWAVTGPTKECVPYTGQTDSTEWVDCVAGVTVTKKWYKYSNLDGCCTGDCDGHTQPASPDAPTDACGCEAVPCPEDCDGCASSYLLTIDGIGAWTVTNAGGACSWIYDDPGTEWASLACSSGMWQIGQGDYVYDPIWGWTQRVIFWLSIPAQPCPVSAGYSGGGATGSVG